MDNFLNAISAVLNVVGTVLMAVIVIGGALLSGGVAWFVLGGMDLGPWARVGGTIAAGFISGFLSWVFINVAALLNLN
jgi:hypothetical protein